jgi:hypothetical protein
MAYPPHTTETTSSRTIVDSGRLWAGGIASAVVAALAGVVGFLVVRGLFGIPVLAPAADGAWGDISTTCTRCLPRSPPSSRPASSTC